MATENILTEDFSGFSNIFKDLVERFPKEFSLFEGINNIKESVIAKLEELGVPDVLRGVRNKIENIFTFRGGKDPKTFGKS